MKTIILHNGEKTIVDEQYYEELNKFNWYLSHGYAARKEKDGRTVYMHRVIMNTPDDKLTDHINHNRLDNRRANLRICDNQQNQQNRKKTEGKTSIYKGVSLDKRLNLWRASIKVEGKIITIGRYNNEEAAAVAYNKYAKKYFKDYSNLNDVSMDINPELFKQKSKRSSKYRGVSWNKKFQKWKAEIYFDCKNHYIGLFDTELEAAIAYDEEVIKNNLNRNLNKSKII